MCGEIPVAECQVEVRGRECEVRRARHLSIAEATQPATQVLAVSRGEVGRGARPDQLDGALVIPGSGRVVDGLLEVLVPRVPGAGAAVELGLDLGLPAMELRGKRLLEEWVVPIGAVRVIERLQWQLRPSELTQDPARARPLENVVADLA